MGVLRGLLEENETTTNAIKPWRVAVLEQGRRCHDGGKKDDKLLHWYTTAHNDNNNNNPRNTILRRAKLGKHRYITVPTGQGRGGTTRINAGLCCPSAAMSSTASTGLSWASVVCLSSRIVGRGTVPVA